MKTKKGTRKMKTIIMVATVAVTIGGMFVGCSKQKTPEEVATIVLDSIFKTQDVATLRQYADADSLKDNRDYAEVVKAMESGAAAKETEKALSAKGATMSDLTYSFKREDDESCSAGLTRVKLSFTVLLKNEKMCIRKMSLAQVGDKWLLVNLEH